jgi:hypothetical protein
MSRWQPRYGATAGASAPRRVGERRRGPQPPACGGLAPWRAGRRCHGPRRRQASIQCDHGDGIRESITRQATPTPHWWVGETATPICAPPRPVLRVADVRKTIGLGPHPPALSVRPLGHRGGLPEAYPGIVHHEWPARPALHRHVATSDQSRLSLAFDPHMLDRLTILRRCPWGTSARR